MERYRELARLAQIEFSELVVATDDFGHKLRIYLVDTSFVDVFVSVKSRQRRFSFHWDRRHLDGQLYRLDNTPDPSWKFLDSFPMHFHDGSYDNVVSPPFDFDGLKENLRNFLNYIRGKVKQKSFIVGTSF